MRHFMSGEEILKDCSLFFLNEMMKKLLFKTLDNKTVKFDGLFEVVSVADYDESPLVKKYFKVSNEYFDLDVHSFILVKGKPIWGLGSHTCPNYYSIFPKDKANNDNTVEKIEEEWNYYHKLAAYELYCIDNYTRHFILHDIYIYCNNYCKELKNLKNNIIDFRKLNYYFTMLYKGFVPPDITHTLPDTDIPGVTMYKEMISDFPDAVKKQEKFKKIAELYRKAQECEIQK